MNFKICVIFSISEHKPETGPAAEPKFMDTINPLLSFSNDELEEMDEEFHEFFESDDSSSDNEIDIGTKNLLIVFIESILNFILFFCF